MTTEPMTSTSTSTTTNEHLQAIHAECSGFVDGEPPDLEVIIQHAEALAAQIERLQDVVDAAASYIDLLDKGKGPSDPAYLPLRDCYRNAVEDLGDTPADPPTPSTPRGAQS